MGYGKDKVSSKMWAQQAVANIDKPDTYWKEFLENIANNYVKKQVIGEQRETESFGLSIGSMIKPIDGNWDSESINAIKNKIVERYGSHYENGRLNASSSGIYSAAMDAVDTQLESNTAWDGAVSKFDDLNTQAKAIFEPLQQNQDAEYIIPFEEKEKITQWTEDYLKFYGNITDKHSKRFQSDQGKSVNSRVEQLKEYVEHVIQSTDDSVFTKSEKEPIVKGLMSGDITPLITHRNAVSNMKLKRTESARKSIDTFINDYQEKMRLWTMLTPTWDPAGTTMTSWGFSLDDDGEKMGIDNDTDYADQRGFLYSYFQSSNKILENKRQEIKDLVGIDIFTEKGFSLMTPNDYATHDANYTAHQPSSTGSNKPKTYQAAYDLAKDKGYTKGYPVQFENPDDGEIWVLFEDGSTQQLNVKIPDMTIRGRPGLQKGPGAMPSKDPIPGPNQGIAPILSPEPDTTIISNQLGSIATTKAFTINPNQLDSAQVAIIKRENSQKYSDEHNNKGNIIWTPYYEENYGAEKGKTFWDVIDKNGDKINQVYSESDAKKAKEEGNTTKQHWTAKFPTMETGDEAFEFKIGEEFSKSGDIDSVINNWAGKPALSKRPYQSLDFDNADIDDLKSNLDMLRQFKSDGDEVDPISNQPIDSEIEKYEQKIQSLESNQNLSVKSSHRLIVDKYINYVNNYSDGSMENSVKNLTNKFIQGNKLLSNVIPFTVGGKYSHDGSSSKIKIGNKAVSSTDLGKNLKTQLSSIYNLKNQITKENEKPQPNKRQINAWASMIEDKSNRIKGTTNYYDGTVSFANGGSPTINSSNDAIKNEKGVVTGYSPKVDYYGKFYNGSDIKGSFLNAIYSIPPDYRKVTHIGGFKSGSADSNEMEKLAAQWGLYWYGEGADAFGHDFKSIQRGGKPLAMPEKGTWIVKRMKNVWDARLKLTNAIKSPTGTSNTIKNLEEELEQAIKALNAKDGNGKYDWEDYINLSKTRSPKDLS